MCTQTAHRPGYAANKLTRAHRPAATGTPCTAVTGMPATAERRLEDGVLWVGGSSGLALTYFEEIGVQRNERFVCTGIEPEAPVALQQLSAGYRDEGAHPDGGSWGRELAYKRLDLTSEASIDLLFGGQPGQKSRLPHGLGTLVLSMRAPLWGDVSGHTLLLRHLGTLLRRAADCGEKRYSRWCLHQCRPVSTTCRMRYEPTADTQHPRLQK